MPRGGRRCSYHGSGNPSVGAEEVGGQAGVGIFTVIKLSSVAPSRRRDDMANIAGCTGSCACPDVCVCHARVCWAPVHNRAQHLRACGKGALEWHDEEVAHSRPKPPANERALGESLLAHAACQEFSRPGH